MEAEFRGVLEYYEGLLSRQPYLTGNVRILCVFVAIDTDTFRYAGGLACRFVPSPVASFPSSAFDGR